MNITGVKSHEIQPIWHLLSWHFADFEHQSRGEFTAGALVKDCIDGKRQCWAAIEDEEIFAVMLTEVHGDTVLMTFCNGKERERWQNEIVAEIRAWAESRGATRLKAIHRPGWSKLLRGMGFKTTHYMSEVDL